jgi:hypothetical protein
MCKYILERYSCGHTGDLKAGPSCALIYRQLLRIYNPNDMPDGIPFEMPLECDPNPRNIYQIGPIQACCDRCRERNAGAVSIGEPVGAGRMGGDRAMARNSGMGGASGLGGNLIGSRKGKERVEVISID